MGIGKPPDRPAAAVRRFLYSEPDPWSWIPGTWITPGAIFAAKDGRFYRFTDRHDDGWDCDEVPATTVGAAKDIADISETRRLYDHRLAAREELEAKMLDHGDTLEARSLIREHNEELHRLRDRLILLCNARTPKMREATDHADQWRRRLVVVLAMVFLAAAVQCVSFLFSYAPESAGRWVLTAVLSVFGLVGAGYGFMLLARHRNRLLQGGVIGNIIGLILLLVLLALGAFFIILLFVAGGIYTRAYSVT